MNLPFRGSRRQEAHCSPSVGRDSVEPNLSLSICRLDGVSPHHRGLPAEALAKAGEGWGEGAAFRTPLCVLLLFTSLGSFALLAAPSPGRVLTLPTTGKTGFVRLESALTGVQFTNYLSDE